MSTATSSTPAMWSSSCRGAARSVRRRVSYSCGVSAPVGRSILAATAGLGTNCPRQVGRENVRLLGYINRAEGTRRPAKVDPIWSRHARRPLERPHTPRPPPRFSVGRQVFAWKGSGCRAQDREPTLPEPRRTPAGWFGGGRRVAGCRRGGMRKCARWDSSANLVRASPGVFVACDCNTYTNTLNVALWVG